MFHQQQQWELDAAYRKGYQKGLIASNPERKVRVNLSSFSAPPDELGIPRWISISVEQSTPVSDVLAELHTRLAGCQYPFIISTVGADAKELRPEDEGTIMGLLPKYDATDLALRLNIELPEGEKLPKKSLSSRLRKVIWSSPRDARSQPAGQTSGVGSPPPSYESTLRFHHQLDGAQYGGGC